jgi:hypothetical protein
LLTGGRYSQVVVNSGLTVFKKIKKCLVKSCSIQSVVARNHFSQNNLGHPYAPFDLGNNFQIPYLQNSFSKHYVGKYLQCMILSGFHILGL